MIDKDLTDDPLEREVEGPAKQFAEKRGWFVAKLMQCDINSMPDCIFHRRGFTLYIEFKKFGVPPNKQQLLRHKQLRKVGIPVHVVDTLEQAHEILR